MNLREFVRAGAPSDLADVVLALAGACHEISVLVRSAATGDLLGSLGSENVQGEVQKRLDVIANQVLLDACETVSCIAAAASEELEAIVPLRPIGPGCDRLVLFDPLDGSSNIDVNVSIGTIFSVLTAEEPHRAREATEADFLQRGREQAAAGYAVFGPQTTLVLTLGGEVAMFSLDPERGDWMLTTDHVALPRATAEFAINASNARHWASPVYRYVDECLEGAEGPRGKNFNMRWVASMVADVHRILVRGGVFLYPWDAREPAKPGKLRLMYEANPMALLVERAGGAAFDGAGPILDIAPRALHQRVSVMLGAAEEIERLEALHAEER